MPYAKPNTSQQALFGEQESWKEEWAGMPEFVQENHLPNYSVRVNFLCFEDLQRFSELMQQPITAKTQYVWFPKQTKESIADKRYVE